uniref:Uncharacterized protein n=1 Tax=Anopheles epiroticus TaxID=199890 RepID=A0A182P380_9DIPT
MLVRCIKILVAVVLSLTFTISLSKLVLCVWNGWFNADAADYEIFASYPGAARHGPSDRPSSSKSAPYGGGTRQRYTPTIVDEWLDHNQLGKYKQLFRDQAVLIHDFLGAARLGLIAPLPLVLLPRYRFAI